MPIQVNDLGTGGVNVDSHPLDLQDTELTNSQNATLGALKNRASALIKRRGLEKLNQASLGAAILGGIEAPYQGTAAAPANGAGGGIINTGDPNLGVGVGPGGSTSVPGNPGSGGNQGNTGIAVGSSVFSPTPLFGGGRMVALGLDAATGPTQGFILTPSGWGSGGSVVYADGSHLPLNTAPDVLTTTIVESPAAGRVWRNFTVANGVAYYGQGQWNETGLTSTPTLPTIMRVAADGKSLTKIIGIPANASVLALGPPSYRVFVTAMATEWGNGDAIWIGIWDEVRSGGSAGHYGRVLRLSGLDSGAYALTEVFNSFTTIGAGASNFGSAPVIPFTLEAFLGQMWMGVIRGTSTGSAPAAGMFRPNPAWPNGWEVTKIVNGSSTSWADLTCMRAYNGTMYFGYVNRAPSIADAVIASLDAAGNYTGTVKTGSAGTVTSPVGFISLEVFNGKLYASYSNAGIGAKIYSFDGTTWSTVLTPATAAYILWADGSNFLYAFSYTPVTGTKHCYVTSDGTNWTDASANFPAAPVNTIFAFDQS